jgi:hypothetical protein
VARRPAESFLFLSGPQPTFDGQNVILPSGLIIHKVDRTFLESLAQKGIGGVEALAGDCAVCVQSTGSDSVSDLLRPVAFHESLVLATDVRSREASQIIREIGTPVVTTTSDLPGRGTVLWGHFRPQLSLADIRAAEQLLPRVEPFHAAEKFSRVGNALLFYRNGYNSDNPDLALVSCTTCLESVFSTFEQELSFRLSLRVATFLADENTERQELFEEAKEVYRIRSKIVHGAKIHKNSETAAIYLVEGVLPQAERLARRCLAKVLEMRIEGIFENAEKLNALFDRLMFSNSLEKALGEMR